LSESGSQSQQVPSVPTSILDSNGKMPLGIGGLGTPVPMPQSSNPNETAEIFAKNAFAGQEPKNIRYGITGPGSWVAELPDGTYITFRPAGQASNKTSEGTATVEVNNSKIRELNNNNPTKFKFPKG
jgi:filamentous hemagglutinin